MFGLSYSEIAVVISLIVTTIAQVFLLISGKTSDAVKLENRKQKHLNKLYKRAEKDKSKLSSDLSKISELEKQNNNEVKNG